MKNGKLIKLLDSLDKKEIRELSLFLASPYFNASTDVVVLFNYLSSMHPTINERIADKKRIFQDLFPGHTYNDKAFRYLVSDLNRLCEQFLANQRMQIQAIETELFLLDELSKRRLEKAYVQAARRLDKKLASEELSERALIINRFRFEEVRQRHFERSHIRKQDFTVERMAHDLDQFYFMYRLYLSCAMLDHQTIFEQPYQINLSTEWIRHLEKNNFLDNPLIKIYYTVYKALEEEENEDHFHRLKSYLFSLENSLHREDLTDIYLFAINYCARKIRNGRQMYIEEALALNVTGIESGVLLQDGLLSPWTFANVVKLSIRLEKYDWIASFMDDYGEKLMPEFRDNALHYNRAELYYATQRYSAAQQELLQVAFSDLNYYLGARVLLAKIYYETQEEEALLSLLASFTIFLKRNKRISKSIKEACLNFCTILFQILRKSPKRFAKLPKEMQAMQLLTERQWLIEAYKEAQL